MGLVRVSAQIAARDVGIRRPGQFVYSTVIFSQGQVQLDFGLCR